MTFGERIKEYRKNMGFTQSTLAERLGISEQSVSKWETGITMPDVSTLVPLASVLGVSVDSLLGVATNADEEINAAYKELGEKWKYDNRKQLANYRHCDRALDYYNVISRLEKKYPNNMNLALNCAAYANEVLYAYKQGWFEKSEKEENALFREIEILTERIWKFDERLSCKKDSKEILIGACCQMGYFGRAEAECENFGWGIDAVRAKRIIAENTPANEIKDYENRFDIRRHECVLMISDALWCYYETICSLASIGTAKLKDTVEEQKNFIRILDAFKGVLSESERLNVKMWTLKNLGGQYCGLGEYDKALETVETIGEAAEDYFRLYKEGVPECLMDFNKFYWNRFNENTTDEEVKETLYWRTTFWDNFEDKENNPIVTSPRYKAVVEKIRNLS